MTVSTEIATLPTSRNSDSLVSYGTHSNRDLSLIWICTEECEFLDLVDFWGVVFSVETVKRDSFIFVEVRLYDVNFVYVTWLIIMCCDSFIWYVTHLYGTWLICMVRDSFIWYVTHLYGTWLIYMVRDSFISIGTHPYMMWTLYMWHDSSWCDVTDSYGTWLYMVRDSFIYIETHSYMMWTLYMWHDSSSCDVTNS